MSLIQWEKIKYVGNSGEAELSVVTDNCWFPTANYQTLVHFQISVHQESNFNSQPTDNQLLTKH